MKIFHKKSSSDGITICYTKDKKYELFAKVYSNL